jgi:hypothetical protein
MRVWACAALLCLGCGPAPTSVLVTIRGTSAVAVAQLSLAVAFADAQPNDAHELLDKGRAESLPAQVIVEVPDTASSVSVLVTATTITGDSVFGSNTAAVVPHEQVALEVQLPLGGDPDLPDGGVLADGSVLRLADGAACLDGDACSSGFCSAGVCCNRACDAGPCETCIATLGASADGTCTLLGAAVSCRVASGVCDVAEVCDGVTGICPADLSSCPSTQYCNGTSCVDKLLKGAACGSDKECGTGHCSDVVCCDQACAGACDACSVAAGAAVNGACQPLTATTVCRAARGACDAAELCDGANGVCPADVRKTAGSVCRGAAMGDPCDIVERCSGTSDTCPADQKATQIDVSFVTSFGRDGFASSSGGLGYQRVEGACYADGSDTRGFLSFGTATLPDAAVIVTSKLTGCELGGPGAVALALYATSFVLPLPSSAYGGTVGPKLVDLPDGSGPLTFTVPTTSIQKTGETQYELRWPEINCGTYHGRRWSSSQSVGQGSECTDKTPFTLDVKYCVP